MQCDQIGLLFRDLGYYISFKNSPIYDNFLDIVKKALFKLGCCDYLYLVQLLGKIGPLLISIFGHTVSMIGVFLFKIII